MRTVKDRVFFYNCTCHNFSFLFQYRCRCRRGLHRQSGGCGCCGGYRRHQRSRGCCVVAVQRGCRGEFRWCGSWGRGSRRRCVWQLTIATFRWSQQWISHASQAEGNKCFKFLILLWLEIFFKNVRNIFILTWYIMQRGDVERGEEEEEDETSTRRGRRGSRASQRSRPYSTARPVVSNVL